MNLACQPDIHVLIHSTEPVWKINRRPIDENLTSRVKRILIDRLVYGTNEACH